MPTPRMDLLEPRRLFAFVPTGASTLNGDDFQSVDRIVPLPGGGYVAAGMFADRTNFTSGVSVASTDEVDLFLQLVQGKRRSTLTIGADSGSELEFDDDLVDYVSQPRRVDDESTPLGISSIARDADEYISQVKVGPDGELYVAVVFKRDISLNTQNARARILQPNDTFESDFFDSAILRYSINTGRFVLEDVKQIGGPFNDVIQDFAFDSVGNLLVAGSFERRCDFDPSARSAIYDPVGRGDAFVAKYGRNNKLQWVAQFGGDADGATELDVANALSIGADDSVFLGGTFSDDAAFSVNGRRRTDVASAEEGTDAFTIRLNSRGRLSWVRAQGGDEFDGIRSVVATPDGDVYSVGYFQDEADVNPSEDVEQIFTANDDEDDGRDAPTDLFFTRFSGDGNVEVVKQLSGDGFELIANASTNPAGDLVLAGSFSGTLDIDPSRRVRLLTTPETDNDDPNQGEREQAYAGFVAIFAGGVKLRNVTQIDGTLGQDVFINGATAGADGRIAIAGRYRGGFSVLGTRVAVGTNSDFDDYREDGYSLVLDARLRPI